ncbi:hypothetical protein EX895_004973 [Sporisorium graminicola]|uniref:Uncharacterized protein n=1 Tax=Sporisorium graminicola TaxID=280036 RepID=A0A4U7KSB8_9BASI|nr:hypothetical protein EX895_004973 [Sporisorium graminicola]TKY86148.1 hypothetical protein EX895_004973 [Sporisorium graminicola]
MSSAYPKIDFYDISCTTTSESWSPYTARIWLALRLLEIPSERHLMPMCRINDTLADAGVFRPLAGRHTLPAITLDQKEWVTDSAAIASTLQKLYLEHGGQLSHSLFPDAASKDLAEKANQAMSTSLAAGDRWKSVVPSVYYILEPESQEFFIETRTSSWKKSPLDILATEAKQNAERDGGIEQVYAKAMLPFVELYATKDKSGTWLGGERPIYADLITLAALQWYKCANTDAFHKALEINGGALQKAWTAGQELLFQQS